MKNKKLYYLRQQQRRKIAAVLAFMIASAAAIVDEEPVRKTRRWWVKPWLQRRNEKGNLHLVHEELAVEDKECYKNFLRMDQDLFERLLKMIQTKIEKTDTRFRKCISARDMLVITLRFLATGESYRSLMYSFRVSESTISIFIPKLCIAIFEALKDKYLKIPTTAVEWLKVAKKFESTWNLPNTIAAMDGKHIVFQPPRSAGSAYYNYKGTNSIVLLALVDADYKFLYVDAGTNGRVSDGGVFKKSKLAKAIERNSINIPKEKPLPGRIMPVPHVIVGDAAFPLTSNIMKPFPFRNLTREQMIFNYRLSRARRVVENAFGILANRFRVLINKINLSAEKVESITLACCSLHNFLKTECPSYIKGKDEIDIDKRYIFKYGLSQQIGNRPKTMALQIRQEFMEYVNGVGAVPWQNENL